MTARSLLPRSRAAFTAIRMLSVPPDVMKPAPSGPASQPFADRRDDLALHRPQTGKRVGVERVLAGVAAIGLLGHRRDVGSAVVHEAERPAVAPLHIVALQIVELGEDRLGRRARALVMPRRSTVAVREPQSALAGQRPPQLPDR